MSDRVVLAESKEYTQLVAIHGTVQSTGTGPEAIAGLGLWVKATESKSRRSWRIAPSFRIARQSLSMKKRGSFGSVAVKFEDESQQCPRTSRDEDYRSRHGNDMGKIDRDARGKL